jgi:predicted MFS family arabinose efflux permease
MYRHYVLVVLLLVFVVHHLDRNIFLLLLEPIGTEFRLSDSELALLAGAAYAVPFAIAGIPLGALVDRVSRIRLLALLIAIWSSCTALAGFARNYAALMVARAAIGAAESGGPPAIMSVITDTYPARSRPAALSILFMGPTLGLLAGSVLGGIAGAAFGWRGALFIAGVPGLVLTVLLLTTLREPVRGALDVARRDEPPGSMRDVLRAALGEPRVRYAILGMVATSVVAIGISSWIPVMLMRVHDLPIARAGVTMAWAAGVPGGLGSLAAAWIATRYGAGRDDRLLRLCGVATAVAVPAGLAGAMAGSVSYAIVGFAVWTFASAMSIGPGHSLYLGSVAPAMRGRLSATVVVTCNLLGTTVGPQIIGTTSDLLRAAGDPHALPHAVALLALGGMLASWLFLRGLRHASKQVL